MDVDALVNDLCEYALGVHGDYYGENEGAEIVSILAKHGANLPDDIRTKYARAVANGKNQRCTESNSSEPSPRT